MGPLAVATLVMAGVGAVGNGIGWFGNYFDTKEQLNREIDQVKLKQQQYADYLNKSFELETLEARKKSNDLNKQTTQAETNLNASLNANMDAMIASQEADLLNYNMQAQAASQAQGDTLTSMASSGVKGSTLSDAAEMQAAQNSMQLQLQQNQNRAAKDINFASLLSNMGANVTNLANQRTEAIDLNNRYLQGGMQQSAWQNNKDYNNKQFENALSQLRGQRDRMKWSNNFWGNLGSLGASILGGGTQGALTGYQLGTVAYQSGLWKDK